MDIGRLGLGRYESLLRRVGLSEVEVLTEFNKRELQAFPGIGPKAVAAIESAVSRLNLHLAQDEWLPYTCARDGRETWDTTLSSFFLCDPCADTFRTTVFNDVGEAYLGAPIEGYCDHCNSKKSVRLRQWLLCGVCYRVLKSIGRGVAAARFFREFWTESISGVQPDLELIETDPPELRRRDGKDDRQSKFDFVARDRDSQKLRFGFELKAGRSHLGRGGIGSGMGRFQLDVTDVDDMLAAVQESAIPAYLVHIQVVDRAEPPTVRYAPVGLWWVDMYTMATGFLQVTQRPRENRPAAYYDPKIFKGKAELADHIEHDGPRSLQRRLTKEGPPRLYAPLVTR